MKHDPSSLTLCTRQYGSFRLCVSGANLLIQASNAALVLGSSGLQRWAPFLIHWVLVLLTNGSPQMRAASEPMPTRDNY